MIGLKLKVYLVGRAKAKDKTQGNASDKVSYELYMKTLTRVLIQSELMSACDSVLQLVTPRAPEINHS